MPKLHYQGHQKRQLPASGIGEMKRDMTARLFNPESFGKESFVSEELAINVLQETKLAFQRAALLSAPGEESGNMETILGLLLQFLFAEHLEYAVELAFGAIPLGESKTEPPLSFLTVLRQTSAITHLFEKQLQDSILPMLTSSRTRESMEAAKRETLARVETKLASGLERLIGAVIGHVKTLLTEQRKADFRPEEEDALPMYSATAKAVSGFLARAVDALAEAVDGDNVRNCLAELGLRFHRALIDHVYGFTFSSSGGMVLLCDINEYRRALAGVIKAAPLVGRLMDALHALANLLVVVPDNLHDATSAELLGKRLEPTRIDPPRRRRGSPSTLLCPDSPMYLSVYSQATWTGRLWSTLSSSAPTTKPLGSSTSSDPPDLSPHSRL